MKIKIIAIGKVKQHAEYKTLIENYIKQNKWQIEIVEISNKLFNSASEIINYETAQIKKSIKNTDNLILLDIHGQNLTSENFAKFIDKQAQINSSLCFIIGGSHGIAENLKNEIKNKISFSKMTFPHIMARLILVEQLYRAWSILNNHPYHK